MQPSQANNYTETYTHRHPHPIPRRQKHLCAAPLPQNIAWHMPESPDPDPDSPDGRICKVWKREWLRHGREACLPPESRLWARQSDMSLAPIGLSLGGDLGWAGLLPAIRLLLSSHLFISSIRSIPLPHPCYPHRQASIWGRQGHGGTVSSCKLSLLLLHQWR